MDDLQPYAAQYAATLRALIRRARTAPDPTLIDAVRTLFADNLDRLRAARRFHQFVRRTQLRARTEEAFRQHRIHLACQRIALDTFHARHHEATAALLALPTTQRIPTATR